MAVAIDPILEHPILHALAPLDVQGWVLDVGCCGSATFPLAPCGATCVWKRRFSLHTQMNKSILTLVVTAALAAFAQAESTVKLSDVHLCCKSCIKGVDKAVGAVSGASAASDADAHTVTITASDDATAQKAVDALVAAGYYGKSENAAIKVKADTGAKDAKVSSLTINDVHLCCPKCV